MAVLERSELEASTLSDLHAIADQVGIDGFRRMRKADLIDAILGEGGGEGAGPAAEDKPPRRSRVPRARRGAKTGEEEVEVGEDAQEAERPSASRRGRGRGRASVAEEEQETTRARRGRGRGRAAAAEDEVETAPAPSRRGRGRASGADEEAEEAPAPSRRGRGRGRATEGAEEAEGAQQAEGVVEVLGNGSAFLRVDPPEPSDDDVYVSAAQVRRCELVSGDRVAGPVRAPRRSERYPSLVRIDTINGASADTVSDGARYEDLPVAWPTERLALGGAADSLLGAIEWLTPLGKGSRAVIVGPRGAGKTETLRLLAGALAAAEGLEVSLVLAGVRPEEVADWQEGPLAPVAALTFAASPDAQAQTVERALDSARRVAARGGDAVVLVDGLDGLPPHAARRALAVARNLKDGGSVTVVATAREAFGGETDVIALAPTGAQPILDLASSATLRPELLVGEDGAEAIAKARTTALER